MRRNEYLFGLNAGGVDPEATARVDMEKMRLAGVHPVSNLIPRVLGPGTLRAGSQSLTRITSDAETRMIRFQRSVGTGYILLMSENAMRISLDGVIQQVPSVSTAIASGSWSNVSTSGASASGGTTLTLNATTTAIAKLRQAVTVASGDQSKVNILRVVVSRGPIFLRIGTTSGGQDLLADAELDTGTHKLGVTPGAGTIYVEVRSLDPATRTVSQIQFESTVLGGTGDLVIPTPWTFDDVQYLRHWQSIDTLFIGEGTQQPRIIEHRGPLSWDIALYAPDDGPFVPGTTRISMTPSARSGNTTLTASEAYFQSGHVGALMELTHSTKTVSETFTDVDQVSDYITVVGVGAGRTFFKSGSSGSWVGSVVLERSFDTLDPANWTTYETYTDGGVAISSTAIDDGQTNLTVHYRFRVSAWTSGTATMQLYYPSGVQVGRARITGYTSSTQVSVEVLRNFGATAASRNWRIGDWSDVRGWPRVPIIHDDRMHWFRDDTDFATYVSDYWNYDDTAEGDAAPFIRSVGTGGQDGVLWALTQDKLLVGTASFEAIIAASELDEPLTPTKYTVRKPSRRGCADVQAVYHDEGAFFIQRSGKRIYELSRSDGKYYSQDVSRLNPAAYKAGVLTMAVQQQPDTRVYAVMEDGQCVLLTYERTDKVVAVTTIDITGGDIEDVAVLPTTDQDEVYFIVKRGTKRYLERLGYEADQRAVSTCTLLDAHKVLTGTITSITGGTHLAGETVQVWADGQRRADVTLDGSGVASLGATYSRVVYGLSYTASFLSVKLAHGAQLGTAIGQTKTVHGAGILLVNSCLDGVRVGRDAANTEPMPDIINGAARTPSQFFDKYDADVFPINSEWDADARIYIEIDSAEGPATIQGVVLDIETKDGASSGNG